METRSRGRVKSRDYQQQSIVESGSDESESESGEEWNDGRRRGAASKRGCGRGRRHTGQQKTRRNVKARVAESSTSSSDSDPDWNDGSNQKPATKRGRGRGSHPSRQRPTKLTVRQQAQDTSTSESATSISESSNSSDDSNDMTANQGCQGGASHHNRQQKTRRNGRPRELESSESETSKSDSSSADNSDASLPEISETNNGDSQPSTPPHQTIQVPQGRSSDRIRTRANREFHMPKAQDVFNAIDTVESRTTLSMLNQRQVASNLTREGHRYNWDMLTESEVSSGAEFVVSDHNAESSRSEEEDGAHTYRLLHNVELHRRVAEDRFRDENTRRRRREARNISSSDSVTDTSSSSEESDTPLALPLSPQPARLVPAQPVPEAPVSPAHPPWPYHDEDDSMYGEIEIPTGPAVSDKTSNQPVSTVTRLSVAQPAGPSRQTSTANGIETDSILEAEMLAMGDFELSANQYDEGSGRGTTHDSVRLLSEDEGSIMLVSGTDEEVESAEPQTHLRVLTRQPEQTSVATQGSVETAGVASLSTPYFTNLKPPPVIRECNTETPSCSSFIPSDGAVTDSAATVEQQKKVKRSLVFDTDFTLKAQCLTPAKQRKVTNKRCESDRPEPQNTSIDGNLSMESPENMMPVQFKTSCSMVIISDSEDNIQKAEKTQTDQAVATTSHNSIMKKDTPSCEKDDSSDIEPQTLLKSKKPLIIVSDDDASLVGDIIPTGQTRVTASHEGIIKKDAPICQNDEGNSNIEPKTLLKSRKLLMIDSDDDVTEVGERNSGQSLVTTSHDGVVKEDAPICENDDDTSSDIEPMTLQKSKKLLIDSDDDMTQARNHDDPSCENDDSSDIEPMTLLKSKKPLIIDSDSDDVLEVGEGNHSRQTLATTSHNDDVKDDSDDFSSESDSSSDSEEDVRGRSRRVRIMKSRRDTLRQKFEEYKKLRKKSCSDGGGVA